MKRKSKLEELEKKMMVTRQTSSKDKNMIIKKRKSKSLLVTILSMMILLLNVKFTEAMDIENNNLNSNLIRDRRILPEEQNAYVQGLYPCSPKSDSLCLNLEDDNDFLLAALKQANIKLENSEWTIEFLIEQLSGEVNRKIKQLKQLEKG